MSLHRLSNKNLQTWPNIPANVTDIRIEKNQLTDIPDSIGSIAGLQRIIINHNKVTKISDSLKNLTNFTDLRITHNNLSIIPESVYDFSKLTVLLLTDNVINKIQPEIGQLKALTQLQLQNNSLETLPSIIGQLSNLTHLYLENNPIEYLPPSIKNLKKLVHLGLTGTKLPLPPSYQPGTNIQETIDFILENQKFPLPELNIKNAYIFPNISKPFLIDIFDNAIAKFSKQYDVSFTLISELKDINKKVTTVLIIISYDVYTDQEIIFKIIDKCSSLNIPYKILFQKKIIHNEEGINLEKGLELQKLRKKIEENFQTEIIPFNSMDEFEGLTFSILKEHKPEVILNSLTLLNIGHFEEAVVKFNKNITCIVGENGRGKSSILRALALAIIGSDNSKISKSSFDNLLRIKSIKKDGSTNYCDSGKISLSYTIDSIGYENIVTLNSKDEGRFVEAISSGDLQINYGEFNLKSLIVGFPQLRGKINKDEKVGKSPYSQPHIDDLIPLLNNNDDNRLDSFIRWIANLYGDSIKDNNKEDAEDTREHTIIKYVFEIISKLMGKEISFMHVQQFTPPIVIISTPEAPNGIPLELISQGFKIVIGWIGYFVQRRIEAFPLSVPTTNSIEKSILLIDEIDSSIHPIWQSRLLDVLRECFPANQIICTTHSPLMLSGLDRDQILEIKNENNKIIVKQNDFDTWVTSYKEILKIIFKTSDFTPKYTEIELKQKLEENSDDPVKTEEIQDIINKLLENQILTDDIKKYEVNLHKKEKELDDLIEEYKQKVQ